MKIASININKRLGNPKSLQSFERWLEDEKIDVVVSQEPWALNKTEIINLKFFTDLGGTNSVRSWVRRKWSLQESSLIADNIQYIILDYVIVINAYLSAYLPEERIAQINIIKDFLNKYHSDSPILIMGDFNLAPNPWDGIVNGGESNFNKPSERQALNQLMNSFHLIDTTSNTSTNKQQEFTIERVNKKFTSKFRCDLALATDYLTHSYKFYYDHSVRTTRSVTDHSAIIGELPISLKTSENIPLDLFEDFYNLESDSTWEYEPYKTAMSRQEPSSIAKVLVELKEIKNKKLSILDYGCGRGKDVSFYRENGHDVHGWDPYPEFGFTVYPNEEQFEIITCTFVLNILPNPFARFTVIKNCISLLKQNGLLLLATRSKDAIDIEGKTKGWPIHHDGYWSSLSRKTFQIGLSKNDLLNLTKRFNLEIDIQSEKFKDIKDATVLLLRKS